MGDIYLSIDQTGMELCYVTWEMKTTFRVLGVFYF
jgi:hypothetical protein